MLRLYVICVAIVISACSENDVEKLEKVRDEVCACKTAKCAEGALGRVPKSTVEPSARAQRVAREMLDCVAEVYDLERPTQDPDAPIEDEAAPGGEATGRGTSAPASAGTP